MAIITFIILSYFLSSGYAMLSLAASKNYLKSKVDRIIFGVIGSFGILIFASVAMFLFLFRNVS